ncbi:MAG: hypothetical protein ABEJ58_02765 [Halodesulfurarchaeum sp.]
MTSNLSDRFERLPETEADRGVPGRPTRTEVLSYWKRRFGIPQSTFEGYTFWEKGAGKIWALDYDLVGSPEIQSLGMLVLRTRQEHWKPTTDAVQRFGGSARKNVIELGDESAKWFFAGETVEVDWDGDWGYLVVSHEVAGQSAPLGVGLFTYGELQSMIPKGRRRDV